MDLKTRLADFIRDWRENAADFERQEAAGDTAYTRGFYSGNTEAIRALLVDLEHVLREAGA